MRSYLEKQIPRLIRAVVKAEIPVSQRARSAGTRKAATRAKAKAKATTRAKARTATRAKRPPARKGAAKAKAVRS